MWALSNSALSNAGSICNRLFPPSLLLKKINKIYLSNCICLTAAVLCRIVIAGKTKDRCPALETDSERILWGFGKLSLLRTQAFTCTDDSLIVHVCGRAVKHSPCPGISRLLNQQFILSWTIKNDGGTLSQNLGTCIKDNDLQSG